MNILSDEEFDRHLEALKERAGMSKADAATNPLAAALARLTDSFMQFNNAIHAAVEEWPEVVLEDILDAEYLGEE